jgi:hypothetical protein
MRLLPVALAVSLTGCLFGQEASQPAVKFDNPFAVGSWEKAWAKTRAAGKPRIVLALAKPPAPICVVPLLEVPIPKDATFPTPQLVPRNDQTENQMIVKPLLPACGQEPAAPSLQ